MSAPPTPGLSSVRVPEIRLGRDSGAVGTGSSGSLRWCRGVLGGSGVVVHPTPKSTSRISLYLSLILRRARGLGDPGLFVTQRKLWLRRQLRRERRSFGRNRSRGRVFGTHRARVDSNHRASEVQP